MCRHLVFLGDESAIGEVVVDPAHGLYRQAWEPRMQKHGTVNADGFGVGWYADGDPAPARYRRTGPMWADANFADLARVVRTGALLAAVRDATEAGADGEAAAAPFSWGPYLFSHNGALGNWPGSVAQLASGLPPAELLALEARCDSALVWALLLHRLRNGEGTGRALTETVREVAAAAPASRLNLLLTDGRTVTASAWGDTLWYLLEPGRRTVVASEPYDDDPLWTEVPDRCLLVATRTDVLLTPFEEPTT
ncbi:ergothioneine biosynthesis protein EgtC [Streptomyces candidus]|uniref:Gamma-glutamyl-hercynylcysteine sulfoxide hydrolase n=1 Tax=Streptomyces candidus TaxID=67283 RepID=A0A7X0LS32_9ACTN|nr:ergothioneine biosynthesis protein EgtC [Streptomyces candidus]MBB6438747.1 glutamine amidotransferase [Streptomyces candidus]GHH53137.1 gamma-glutamyl-hercynylcysteine sulfoxide hydrolase [Streptomyces candidus]